MRKKSKTAHLRVRVTGLVLGVLCAGSDTLLDQPEADFSKQCRQRRPIERVRRQPADVVQSSNHLRCQLQINPAYENENDDQVKNRLGKASKKTRSGSVLNQYSDAQRRPETTQERTSRLEAAETMPHPFLQLQHIDHLHRLLERSR